jgi:gamma-glutamylcysteine synthetase
VIPELSSRRQKIIKQKNSDKIYKYFMERFHDALEVQSFTERRIGSELKFPMVNLDGTAASFDTVCGLWTYLESRGWKPVQDKMTGRVVGARKKGQQNDTVAGCETGFCKAEFSLAHVANLFDLQKQIDELRAELKPFCDKNKVCFLCYGIQPVSPPSKRLMIKKRRTSPWTKAFGSNRCIDEKDGDDMHLFTINAASHVHVSVSPEEAIDAVNVLNGFSGAQIALTANSNIWQGRTDPDYKCVAEKFWDWWMPDSGRVGMPRKPFKDIEDYVGTIVGFKPVYVVRNGNPIVLEKYETFEEYYRLGRAVGRDTREQEVSFVPDEGDIDIHNSCYWYNARISRYFTVENRVNDQQPPDALLCIAAMTLGLVSVLSEAKAVLSSYDWEILREAREVACREGLLGKVGDREDELALIALRMWALARQGLIRRGLGEEKFLDPLERRLHASKCPADRAENLFESGGIDALLDKWRF